GPMTTAPRSPRCMIRPPASTSRSPRRTTERSPDTLPGRSTRSAAMVRSSSSRWLRPAAATTLALHCEHAFADMTRKHVEVVTIGTGGTDSFHAPARALYESLGCVPWHVVYYLKQLPAAGPQFSGNAEPLLSLSQQQRFSVVVRQQPARTGSVRLSPPSG